MERENGKLLRIYIDEEDKFEGKPVYRWLVERARKEGLCGVTVLRGILGYGARGKVHSANILRMANELPLVVEIVDSEEKIEKFMVFVERAVKEGLATIEDVKVEFYRLSQKSD